MKVLIFVTLCCVFIAAVLGFNFDTLFTDSMAFAFGCLALYFVIIMLVCPWHIQAEPSLYDAELVVAEVLVKSKEQK